MVLLFEKASTRTRVSFEVGIARLGAHPVVLSVEGSQIARGEPLKDTARVLAGYCDAVMRTFGHDRIEEMATYAQVPVINALTDLLHPCQVLADCFTLAQRFGDLSGKKIAWIGDGNNMANSWINAAAVLGFDLTLACPEGFEPDKNIMDAALKDGREGFGGARPEGGGQRGHCREYGCMGQHGPGGRDRRNGSPSPTTRSMPASQTPPHPMPCSCTACRPTVAKRSPPRSSTVRAAWCGTRRRTACTRKRPCSRY